MSTAKKYWVYQCVGWGAYCVFGFATSLQYTAASRSLIAGYALFFAYSLGLTDWFRQQIRERNWLELPALYRVPRLFAGVLSIAAIQTTLVVTVDYAFRRVWWPWLSIFWLFVGTTNANGMWIFLYVQMTARRRRREHDVRMQLALRDAELRALESQINPHFLFNCLNSIRALVSVDPPRAQDMLTRLANVLRHSLRQDIMHTVPLAGEVESVSDYLALEAVRFEERLQVQLSIDPAAAQCHVPPMLLHTLVENAVKHGIAEVTERGDLIVRAVRQGDIVRIEVENTGQLRESSPEPGKVGLTNARERLRLLYGTAASLNLRNEKDRVMATVEIPVAQS